MKSLYCVIVGANGRLLFRSGRGSAELPRVEVETVVGSPFVNTAAMCHLAASALRLDLTLCYIMDIVHGEQTALVAGFEACHPTAPAPPPLHWADPQEPAGRLQDRLEARLLAAHLATCGVEEQTPICPWLQCGWLHAAEAWAIEQLAARGVPATARAEHVKAFFWGAVLRIPTAAGRIYFKALPSAFGQEVAATAMLSAWQPARIPRPLAVDLPGRRMLTKEVEGPTLSEVRDVATWEEALRAYARLQKESLGSLTTQPETPLYDLRVGTVAAGVEQLAADLERLQRGYAMPVSHLPDGRYDALDAEEIEALREVSPRLVRMCQEIESYGVPDTLEHSDLHPGNIRITENGPVFLDWAWSCVSHPLTSLSLLLHPHTLPAPLQTERERLRDVYLDEWMDFAPRAQLQALARLVHQWRVLQYAAADADWLRAFLERLPPDLPPDSYQAWTLRERQYFFVKSVRRVLEVGRGMG